MELWPFVVSLKERKWGKGGRLTLYLRVSCNSPEKAKALHRALGGLGHVAKGSVVVTGAHLSFAPALLGMPAVVQAALQLYAAAVAGRAGAEEITRRAAASKLAWRAAIADRINVGQE